MHERRGVAATLARVTSGARKHDEPQPHEAERGEHEEEDAIAVNVQQSEGRDLPSGTGLRVFTGSTPMQAGAIAESAVWALRMPSIVSQPAFTPR